MEFMMERWYSAVGQRFSVRRYKAAPPDAEWEALMPIAEMLSANGVRIALCCRSNVFTPIFLGYGRVKGTDCFAALVTEEGAAPYAPGYLGEAFALECAALGLGTCWLAQYNRQLAKEVAGLEAGETLSCILAVGEPGEPYAARPRKPLDKLTGLGQAQLQALPEWQQRALECARLAPSAVNGQPWRFEPTDEGIRIVNTSPNHGYGKLDCGIAMLHIELGAAHCGVAGEWVMEDDDTALFQPAREEELDDFTGEQTLDSPVDGAYNDLQIKE